MVAVPDLSASLPFEHWQRAVVALRVAETRGAGYSEILRLSEDVIRSRNALILDRVEAGWQPTPDILEHVNIDAQLLRAHDDRSTSRKASLARNRPAAAAS